ncbi:gliding motility-associated C-terminal domain-containing protein [Jiulongibacter sp. NS-SX5]|uniref:gliding motility-associated C-terminal domain-containing protein n=1 Tax=Jiulongibacter sp. NS-SX5 TaxID=3463854 RepID=UPI00405A0A96
MKIIYQIYFFVRKLFLPGGYVLLFALAANGQNLCSSSSNDKLISDGFSFIGPSSGCGPFTVNIEDNTGYSDIKYIYTYNGESASQLNNLGAIANTEYTYFADDENKTYTILQYGKDDSGETFYSCKNVTVRANDKPKFSYTICNNTLNISLPLDSANSFDSYSLKINSTEENIEPNQLPFNKDYTVNFPIELIFKGNFSDGSANCGTIDPILIESLNPSSQPYGIDLEYHPNINSIVMESGTKGIMEFQGAYGSSGYSFYRTEMGVPYSANPTMKNVQPGSVEFEIPDSSKSYCFYAVRTIACGIEQSAEICTIPFNFPIGLEKENKIEVPQYKERQYDFPNEPQYGRNHLYSLEILKSENGDNYEIIPIFGVTDEVIDPIDCKQDYCYRVKAKVSGQLYYFRFEGESTSAERCISRKTFQPDSLTKLYASVEDDKSIIRFNDNSGWSLNKDMFYLFSNADSSTFYLADSTQTEALFSSAILSDTNPTCFKVGYKDECGSYSKLSPEICTVFLETDGNQSLIWSDILSFSPEEVSHFEIQQTNEQNGQETSIYSESSTQSNTLSPDLDAFENLATFRLKAYNFQNEISYSNYVSIPISTNLYFPTAFSPNGDQINDTFEIKGNLGTLASFELYIYDRLALEVFRSTDPEHFWDGTLNGNPLPSGTYQYALKATNKQNEEIRKHGYMVLLR